MGELDLILPGPTDPAQVLDVVEDFMSGTASTGTIGQLGWQTAAGTVTATAAEAGHPGILRIDTSAVSATIGSLYGRTGATTGTLLPAEFFDLVWTFRLNTNDTDTRVRLGLAVNFTSAAPTDGVYLEKADADTQWFGVCRASSVESRTAALATIETSNWHKVRIRRITASAIGFSFDGGAEVTVTTNIPTTGLQFGAQIRNNAAASKTIDFDYFRLKVTGLSR